MTRPGVEVRLGAGDAGGNFLGHPRRSKTVLRPTQYQRGNPDPVQVCSDVMTNTRRRLGRKIRHRLDRILVGRPAARLGRLTAKNRIFPTLRPVNEPLEGAGEFRRP